MVKREKKQFIMKMSEYDSIDDIFVIRSKKGISSYTSGYRFNLVLGDRTGEIEFKYWGGHDKDSIETIYNSLHEDDVIYLTGKVSKWQNKLELNSNNKDIFTKIPREEYFLKDFISTSQKDLDSLFNEVQGYIDQVQNEKLNLLLKKIFGDNEIKSLFIKSPLTIFKHYNWVGGLMEHTINVTTICDNMSKTHPSLDRDMLIAGALVHDIGKIKCYKITTNIKENKKNLLIGHVILGVQIVSRFAYEINLDESLFDKLINMISTHHGELEVGFMVKPSMPESVILKYSNDLDSKAKYILKYREESNEEIVRIKDLGRFLIK